MVKQVYNMVYVITVVILISLAQHKGSDGKEMNMQIQTQVNRISEMGLYMQKLGNMIPASPVYNIIVPIDLDHMVKFAKEMLEHLKEFEMKWLEQIKATIADLYKPKPIAYNSSEELMYNTHINKFMTGQYVDISVWNKEDWTENSLEGMVLQVHQKLKGKNISIPLICWYKLVNNTNFKTPKEYANLLFKREATEEMDNMTAISLEDLNKGNLPMRKYVGEKQHLKWLIEALNRVERIENFEAEAIMQIKIAGKELVGQFNRVRNCLDSIINFLPKYSKKRGLLNIFSLAGNYLMNLYNMGQVHSIKHALAEMKLENSRSVQVTNRLETIVKLSALKIGRVEKQQERLITVTRLMADQMDNLLNREKSREIADLRTLTLQAIKNSKMAISMLITLFESTLNKLARELSEAKQGILNPELITPNEVKRLVNVANSSRSRVTFADINTAEALSQLYQSMQVELTYLEKSIVINVKIPMKDKNQLGVIYKINKVEYPVSKESEVRAILDLDFNYVVKFENGDVMGITDEMLEKCKQIEKIVYCKEEIVKYMDEQAKKCINYVINPAMKTEEIDCPVKKVKGKQAFQIKLLEEGVYMYGAPRNATITTVCQNKEGIVKKMHHLARMGLLYIPGECEASNEYVRIPKRIRETHRMEGIKYSFPTIENISITSNLDESIWAMYTTQIYGSSETLKKMAKDMDGEELRNNLEEMNEKFTIPKEETDTPMKKLMIWINMGLTLSLFIGVIYTIIMGKIFRRRHMKYSAVRKTGEEEEKP